MVAQWYTDLLDDTGHMNIEAWRCLVCGEVCDPVILANRAKRPEPDVPIHVRKRRAKKLAREREAQGREWEEEEEEEAQGVA